MRRVIKDLLRVVLMNALVVFMVALSVMVIPPTMAKAASNPTLTKTSRNILAGKKYDLNIKNKIKNSTYSWSTSNKKIAKVTNKGIVTGVNKGTATITCKVTTSKETFALSCKVTIIEPAKRVKITNDVSTLCVGDKYDLNRMLIPSSSNDKTTWTSSDKTIAAPDAKGKFTALKTGIVTITGKTLSGAKDSVTIEVVEKEGIAQNQKELEALLGSGVAIIRIKTADVVKFIIPKGDYSKQKLVVDAPKSDVTNNGLFASIEIKQIASDTWYEKATGNVIDINSLIARIVVESGASTSINMSFDGATLKIENNGTVTELVMDSESAVNITGSSKEAIPITANTANIKITTNIPLALTCTAKIDLVLLAGSEATTVQAATKEDIPSISGTAKIVVTVGTGTDAIVETVTATPIVNVPAGGGTGGFTDPGPSTPTSLSITLDDEFSRLKTIRVNYGGIHYDVDEAMLILLKDFLDDDTTLSKWTSSIEKVKVYPDVATVKVTPTSDEYTKTVTFTSGLLSGREYTVTVNPTGGSVTLTNMAGTTYTITKSRDNNTLTITGVPTGLTFTDQRYN